MSGPRPFSDEHRAKVRENGASGGAPPGNLNGVTLRPALRPPSPQKTAAIIEHAALCVMEGQSPYNAAPLINPISEQDRRQLARFTGITADEFTQRLTTRLRALADLTIDRIQQKLEADQFRPHELSFLLTVGVDKLQRVEGKGMITGANVNVQINNFGPQTKDEIIARLTGHAIDLPSTPVQFLTDEQAPYDPGPAPNPAPAAGSNAAPSLPPA